MRSIGSTELQVELRPARAQERRGWCRQAGGFEVWAQMPQPGARESQPQRRLDSRTNNRGARMILPRCGGDVGLGNVVSQ